MVMVYIYTRIFILYILILSILILVCSSLNFKIEATILWAIFIDRDYIFCADYFLVVVTIVESKWNEIWRLDGDGTNYCYVVDGYVEG